jgi:hypothetical protein
MCKTRSELLTVVEMLPFIISKGNENVKFQKCGLERVSLG